MNSFNNKVFLPRKRFPYFKNNWTTKLYGDVYSFYSTNSFSRDKLNYVSGLVYNIHYGDIHTKFSTMFKLNKELVPLINTDVDLSKFSDEKYCKEGDLVIADASEDYADIGKTIELVGLNNGRVLAGLHTFLARPNKYEMAKGFAGYLMQSWKVRKQVMVIAQGTKVLGLSTARLAKINLFIPEYKEQLMIAEFLSSVDKKIQLLEKKKEQLELYKKGVMQKIFSREIRFKDNNGNSYPDWEEKKLRNVCDVVVGGTPSTYKKEYWDGEIGWISSGDLNNGNVTKPSKLITKLGLDNSSAKMMPNHTVMLAMTGATLGKIGYLMFNSSANQSVAGFLPNETYSSKYLFYSLQNGINQVFKYSGGAAQQGINKNSILNLIYNFPKLEEQKKIAEFLSAIDNKIDTTSNQINKTKEFKKGLLQQMFV